jgi:peptidoglycan/LPS O-acetylase OafA/YrhL
MLKTKMQDTRPVVDPPAHVAGIDFLRAIAVLTVVLFHLNASWLPGGFVGVDVFFVISGYVVTCSLLGRGSTSFAAFLSSFYARRLVRIYPALVCCLLLTFAVSVLFIPAAWLSMSMWWTGLQAFLGVSNIGMTFGVDGYFSPRAESNPFTHTWSLGVEEQFYLLFPVMAWSLIQCRTDRGFRWLLALLTALSVVSFGIAAWYGSHAPLKAFYLIQSRFWELAVGVGLAALHSRKLALPTSPLAAATLFGLAVALLATAFVYSRALCALVSDRLTP